MIYEASIFFMGFGTGMMLSGLIVIAIERKIKRRLIHMEMVDDAYGEEN